MVWKNNYRPIFKYDSLELFNMYLESSQRRNCTWGIISISFLLFFSMFAVMMVSGDQTVGDALLSGVISDTQDDPVDSVTVIALDENGNYLGHTWSNSTGNFTIEVYSILLPQEVVLVIMKDGYFESMHGFPLYFKYQDWQQ